MESRRPPLCRRIIATATLFAVLCLLAQQPIYCLRSLVWTVPNSSSYSASAGLRSSRLAEGTLRSATQSHGRASTIRRHAADDVLSSVRSSMLLSDGSEGQAMMIKFVIFAVVFGLGFLIIDLIIKLILPDGDEEKREAERKQREEDKKAADASKP
eukprot:TRINITY_DN84529_c0_g1_i1.p1 TRINITY_DN84529_c0_g1~~TRINITY_DN84529_c0_g1_i1.p1  ORF type:complete len:156 (-),score=18.82 TRINITY_DN84529_c0_g1_i1:40-507(-)